MKVGESLHYILHQRAFRINLDGCKISGTSVVPLILPLMLDVFLKAVVSRNCYDLRIHPRYIIEIMTLEDEFFSCCMTLEAQICCSLLHEE